MSQENRLVKELELLKDELAPLEERRKFLAQMVIFALRYSNHPKTGLVRFSNGPNISSCQMVRFLNGIAAVLNIPGMVVMY